MNFFHQLCSKVQSFFCCRIYSICYGIDLVYLILETCHSKLNLSLSEYYFPLSPFCDLLDWLVLCFFYSQMKSQLQIQSTHLNRSQEFLYFDCKSGTIDLKILRILNCERRFFFGSDLLGISSVSGSIFSLFHHLHFQSKIQLFKPFQQQQLASNIFCL